MIDCNVCGRGAASPGGHFRECEGQWLCGTCWDNVVRGVLALVARPTEAEGQQCAWARDLLRRVAHTSRSGS